MLFSSEGLPETPAGFTIGIIPMDPTMTLPLLLLAAVPTAPPPPVAGLTLPPGFVAHLYAEHTLANDIYTMTIDDAGRVLVAGRGYVRVLVDEDGDGKADRAIDLIDGLKDGPMGLLAEGDSLYVVADGGLKRYRGYNGKDKLTHPPETLLALKTSGEHEAHAVRRGPDGWLYLLCGNMAGVKKQWLDKRSPVKDPVAGCLLRISPDGKAIEVVADGFRNAYGFDFNTDGEPFTYDSDNERCVGLPWYEGCRFYHVVPGGNYGWRSPQLSQTWRKPPYFVDVVPPICDTGRGSPTGVACYRNSHFPQKYRGGFFLADWTFGKVYFVPLKPDHSTYEGTHEPFLESTGENGFAPTALAVHPKTGELFVSIGGRGTRGGVYRISYPQGGPAKELPIAKRSLEYSEAASVGWLADATSPGDLDRRHALELLLRYKEQFPELAASADLMIRNLDSDDALIRILAARLTIPSTKPLGDLTPTLPARARIAIAEALLADNPEAALNIARKILETAGPPAPRLAAVRIIQLALGDLTAPEAVGTVWEGYTFRRPVSPAHVAALGPVLRAAAIDEDTNISREATRTLAAIGLEAGPSWRIRYYLMPLAARVKEQFHDLIVFARLGTQSSPWSWIGLLEIDKSATEAKILRDRHWPIRLAEIAAAFARVDPTIPEKVLAHESFGRPEHLKYVEALRLNRTQAARKFLDAAKTDPDYDWTPGIVLLLGTLPAAEVRSAVLPLWDRGGFEDAILRVLAKAPQPDDVGKFITGLHSLDPETVLISAVALRRLPPAPDKAELIAAIRALRRLPDDNPSSRVREALATLLRERTELAFGPDPKMWSRWFAKAHPTLASKLAGSDRFDPAAWQKREAAIPWASGDPATGIIVFAKATCAACHDKSGAIGPALSGVGKRFSRDDLLTAILQPSKDVSPRYRPTRITTTDGKTHIGMIVYEATDGVILQTGPDTTIRVAGNLIETKKVLETSLMPAGLLDNLTDREIADLLAYLRGLGETPPRNLNQPGIPPRNPLNETSPPRTGRARRAVPAHRRDHPTPIDTARGASAPWPSDRHEASRIAGRGVRAGCHPDHIPHFGERWDVGPKGDVRARPAPRPLPCPVRWDNEGGAGGGRQLYDPTGADRCSQVEGAEDDRHPDFEHPDLGHPHPHRPNPQRRVPE